MTNLSVLTDGDTLVIIILYSSREKLKRENFFRDSLADCETDRKYYKPTIEPYLDECQDESC